MGVCILINHLQIGASDVFQIAFTRWLEFLSCVLNGKIMFDVQPTEHLQVENPRKLYLSLYIEVGYVTSVNTIVSPPKITLLHTFDEADNQLPA